MVNIINNNLSSLKSYCDSNRLLINFYKTRVMYCKVRNLNLDVTLNSSLITLCDSYRLLGVIVDNNMKYTSQSKFVTKKLDSCIYILRKYQRILPRQTLKIIFNCIGLSHILYCLGAYVDLLSVTDFKRLERKYLRCGKSILSSPVSSYDEILTMLSWRNFHEITQHSKENSHHLS